MSIKSAIKRLENLMTKNRSQQSVTYVIPYCKDDNQMKVIQQKIMKDTGHEYPENILTVFVIDYALNI